MNKKQTRQLAYSLLLFLVIIIALTIWLAQEYGLGSKERELSFLEAKELFATLFDLERYDDISIVKSYEYIDKNHKNRYLHFLISYENKANLPVEMNLESQPLNSEVITELFTVFPNPDWWQPDTVRRGFYYSGIYQNLQCDIIIDSEKKLYYFLAKIEN